MTLGKANRRTIAALSEALLPSGGVPQAGALDVGVPERVEDYVANFPTRMQRYFKLLTYLWDVGPLLGGKGRRFRRLSFDERTQWTNKAAHSKRLDRRIPFVMLKQLIFMAYASAPEVEQALGFDYTCRHKGEQHGVLP